MASDNRNRVKPGVSGGEFARHVRDESSISLNDGIWPAIGYEARDWTPAEDQQVSRRAALSARGPYQAAVPPEIAQLTPAVDPETAAFAEEAVVELARFDAEVGSIAAPFSAILLRTESASSSEIENLTSGARAIALAELGRASAANARLIVGNVRAMEAALALSDRLIPDSVIAMQSALLHQSAPEMTGEFRNQQVWIGSGFANSPHSASFVPPHHDRVEHLMNDVMAFVRRTDLPVLPQVAIAHAQFETVHPFPDGNGRTGRAIVQAMLRRLQVTRNVTVPVSAGLLQDTDGYFRALTSYRQGDTKPIVEVFARAVFAAIVNGRQLVYDLGAVRSSWARATTARAGSSGQRILDVLQQHPIIDANAAAAELGVTAQNAQSGIDRLVHDGILTQIGSGSRNRVWQAAEVLDALDRFAERAKRKPVGRTG